MLVVVVVLGAAVAVAGVAGARSGIGDGVRRQMARALCVVGGGGDTCEADRQPCLVHSDEHKSGFGVHVAVFRFGRKSGVIVEELSDGTFRVIKTGETKGGLAFVHGASVDVGLGSHKLKVGTAVEAALMAQLGDNDTWNVPNKREADELVAALKHDAPHRPPDVAADEQGWSASLGATASRGNVGGALALSAEDIYGSSVDRETGRRTVYVRPSREIEGTLTLGAVTGHAGAGGSETYGVTYDRAGVPVEITVLRGGTYHLSADLPREVKAAAGLLRLRASTGREYSVETRLALTTDADRRLATTFIDQVVHPDVIHTGSPVDVSRALEQRLTDAGMVNARVYAVDEGGFHGAGEVGRVVGVGGELGIGESREMRLVSAASRGPDGVWFSRADCLSAARA